MQTSVQADQHLCYLLPKKQKQKTLSHLSAHVVNCLLRENRKFIPNVLNGKKTF